MANFVPFNGHQVNVSNFPISTPSEMSIDSYISTPSTFRSWKSSSSPDSPLKNNYGKLGLGMIASLYDQEADAAYEATFGFWKSTKSTSKSTLFRHDIKFHAPNAAASADNSLVRPILFSDNYMLTLSGIPETDGVSVLPNLRVSDTVYGPRGNTCVRRIFRVIWPCILASAEIRLALIREALGYPPAGSIQLAICTTHGNVGILKLEEIEHTEEYTCIIHHQPEQKVVHMYNQCVLIFPPNELNHFPEKNEKLSPPIRLKSDDNMGSSNTSCFTDKFLKFCMICDKSLEGEDIYIYRGDSSFCSEECRERKIEADRQKESMKAAAKKSYSKSNSAAITDKRSFAALSQRQLVYEMV